MIDHKIIGSNSIAISLAYGIVYRPNSDTPYAHLHTF